MEIDKGAEKKLKRGLHDLSPLFGSVPSIAYELPAASLRPAPFDAQFLTVCTPDHEGDAFLTNAYFASQMVKRSNLSASLISIAPGMNALPAKVSDPLPALELLDSRISRLRLSHQELWSFTQNGFSKGLHSDSASSAGKEAEGVLVFLDFEPSQFRSLSRISLLLDRVIFFIEPEVESLREAYRLMKVFWQLNREIDFFLLFREEDSEQAREAYLFEQFSLITSRFLGLSSRWLGHLAFPERKSSGTGEGEGLGFQAEVILQAEGLHRPLSPEKNRFWQGLREIFQGRLHRESSVPHS